MNLPNKLTVLRVIMIPFFVIALMLEGGNNQMYRYIAAAIFVIASFTDFLDGYIARKYNIVTDFGKVMDAIADKVLVNGVLIILAWEKMLPLVVPVIIITRDIVVDSIKMASGSKGKVVAASWPGKIKTICMMIGVTLTFFYNMPFAFIGEGIAIDSLFIFVAVIMSIYSACQYYWVNKDFLFSEM